MSPRDKPVSVLSQPQTVVQGVHQVHHAPDAPEEVKNMQGMPQVASANASATAPSAIWLASTSPRRAELLHQIGVPFDSLHAEAEEDIEALEASVPGETATAYVARVCQLKLDAALARLVRRALPPRPVLVADTAVCLAERVLGKPMHAEDALAMLRALQGTTHTVLSGVALAWPQEQSGRAQGITWQRGYRLQGSQVAFAALGESAMRAYVASGEPFGKAGGYAVQGRAAAFIAHLQGSYSGVMGLPLFETCELLALAQAAVALR